jgi:hypothetical protein
MVLFVIKEYEFFFFFDETSSEGGELPHCIIGRGKMVQLIRETGPKDRTSTVN